MKRMTFSRFKKVNVILLLIIYTFGSVVYWIPLLGPPTPTPTPIQNNSEKENILNILQNNSWLKENLGSIQINPTNSNLTTLSFCSKCPGGVGNWLSAYWLSRSLSYFIGINWNGSCLNKFTSDFIHYLPKYSNNTYSSYANYTSLDGIKWITTNIFEHTGCNISIYHHMNKSCKHILETTRLTGFSSQTSLLYQNELFRQVIAHEVHTAYLKWFDDRNKPIFTELTANDITIYFRCGDLFDPKTANPQYGMLSLSFYKIALNILKQKHLFFERSEQAKIWFITQYSRKNTFKGRAPHFCKDLVEKYVIPTIKNEISSIFGVVIPNDNFIVRGEENGFNVDYYILVNSPVLICSDSSFCSTAAIANNKGIVIMHYQSNLFRQTVLKTDGISECFNYPSNFYNIKINGTNGMELNPVVVREHNMNMHDIGKHFMSN